MRIAVEIDRGEADALEQFVQPVFARTALRQTMDVERLRRMSRTVRRGSRLAYGSWKTICIDRRVVRSSSTLRC